MWTVGINEGVVSAKGSLLAPTISETWINCELFTYCAPTIRVYRDKSREVSGCLVVSTLVLVDVRAPQKCGWVGGHLHTWADLLEHEVLALIGSYQCLRSLFGILTILQVYTVACSNEVDCRNIVEEVKRYDRKL